VRSYEFYNERTMSGTRVYRAGVLRCADAVENPDSKRQGLSTRRHDPTILPACGNSVLFAHRTILPAFALRENVSRNVFTPQPCRFHLESHNSVAKHRANPRIPKTSKLQTLILSTERILPASIAENGDKILDRDFRQRRDSGFALHPGNCPFRRTNASHFATGHTQKVLAIFTRSGSLSLSLSLSCRQSLSLERFRGLGLRVSCHFPGRTNSRSDRHDLP